MTLPALPVSADTRSITERVNVLVRDYNTPSGLPAGCIMPYAGATAPDGWLLCHGQAVSRTTYADLFAAIGTAYGAGDGSTTFNVPDVRGRVVAGKDDMGGADPGRLVGGVASRTVLGAAGGAATHALSVAEMPSHGHAVVDPGHFHSAPVGANIVYSSGGNPANSYNHAASFTPNTGSKVTGISIQNAGGGGAHNNTQPTLILNYVIAT